MLRAITYHDLPGAIIQSVVGCQFVRDRLAQFRDAGVWRVFRETGFQRLDRGPFYMLGCIRIRFACTETANVEALGFHGFRLAID